MEAACLKNICLSREKTPSIFQLTRSGTLMIEISLRFFEMTSCRQWWGTLKNSGSIVGIHCKWPEFQVYFWLFCHSTVSGEWNDFGMRSNRVVLEQKLCCALEIIDFGLNEWYGAWWTRDANRGVEAWETKEKQFRAATFNKIEASGNCQVELQQSGLIVQKESLINSLSVPSCRRGILSIFDK